MIEIVKFVYTMQKFVIKISKRHVHRECEEEIKTHMRVVKFEVFRRQKLCCWKYPRNFWKSLSVLIISKDALFAQRNIKADSEWNWRRKFHNHVWGAEMSSFAKLFPHRRMSNYVSSLPFLEYLINKTYCTTQRRTTTDAFLLVITDFLRHCKS